MIDFDNRLTNHTIMLGVELDQNRLSNLPVLRSFEGRKRISCIGSKSFVKDETVSGLFGSRNVDLVIIFIWFCHPIRVEENLLVRDPDRKLQSEWQSELLIQGDDVEVEVRS